MCSEKLLDAAELAEIIGLEVADVHALARGYRIAYVTIRGKRKFRRDLVQQALEKQAWSLHDLTFRQRRPDPCSQSDKQQSD